MEHWLYWVIAVLSIPVILLLNELALIIREKIMEGKRLKKPRYRD